MKIINYIQLALLLFLFGSCQKEESTVVNQSPSNIIANSPLAKLISRTSQNPTACDNVLDNNSCFSVQLPVTLIVNATTITVTTSSDYQLVKNAINAYSNDDDIVHFNYPITIKYKNYSTKVINSYNQLHDAIEACGADDGFDEISCIAINYPVSINIYNSTTQVANTISIQNNSQLFNFIATLSNGIIATIFYPISVTNSNGQNVVIHSNSELETFIESSIDDCDNSSNSNLSFTATITSGTWRVTYFYDDQDETSNYNGFNFTFLNNGIINVIKNADISHGSWSNYIENGQNKMNLSFENSGLNHLQDDWRVIEYTESTVHLKHNSGGSGDTDYLYFSKN